MMEDSKNPIRNRRRTDSSIFNTLSDLGTKTLGEANVTLLKDAMEELKCKSVAVRAIPEVGYCGMHLRLHPAQESTWAS